MDNLVNQMKDDYDRLLVIDYNDYLKLFEYLRIKNYKKGEILKSHDEVEHVYRYIFSGNIALYEYRDKRSLCRRIYNANEIACDFDSYSAEVKSNFIIKAFTDVQVAELNKTDEFKIIENIPAFPKLALKIYHRTIKKEIQWRKLLWMEKRKAYITLQKICPVFNLLNVFEIAAILNLPERSVFRLRKEISQG